eukprot:scaffold5975_cov112-Isochrysis_galbana.AAC.4
MASLALLSCVVQARGRRGRPMLAPARFLDAQNLTRIAQNKFSVVVATVQHAQLAQTNRPCLAPSIAEKQMSFFIMGVAIKKLKNSLSSCDTESGVSRHR